MNARDIAKALGGGEWRGDGWHSCRCLNPRHGKGKADKHPSLSLKDGANGLIVHCHAGCHWRDVKDELRRRGLYDGRVAPADSREVRARTDGGHRDLGVRLWKGGELVDGTLAEKYLREHRGITIPLPVSLRFHRRVKVSGHNGPALLAAISGDDGKVISVQVTWLRPHTAEKIARRTYGAMEAGTVRLGAVTDALCLAEGVETALSVMELCELPCWATLGALRFKKVSIPKRVETLHIFSDGDPTGYGEAEDAARRLRRDYTVHLRMPDELGDDWNDVLLARRKRRAAA
jgi:putative DNA primase/helicase